MAKKVAHICTSRNSYKMLEDKLWLLTQRGYNIHLISSEEGTDSGFFREKGIPLHFVEMDRAIHPVKDLQSLWALVKLLKKMKFDIVHTHTAKAGFIGRIAAKIARVPLIIHTSHGLPFYQGQGWLKYHFYKYLEILAAKFCQYVGTQNLEDYRILAQYINKEKLYYEGNGINLKGLEVINLELKKENLLQLKRENGIPPGWQIILMGARFEPVKDHLLLLESLKLLKDSGEENFCCLFLGTGPLQGELEKQTKRFGLSQHVRFMGYKNDIYPWLKLADLIVLSSQKEGIPRILMESMVFRKPVAATDVVGTRELIFHEENGLLSPYRNPSQLALNISRLLNNKLLRERFGLAGRRIIEDNFTNEMVIERITNLYRLI